MADPRQLTIELIGSESGGAVRLTDFLNQLEALRDAFRETERLITGQAPTLYFRIIGLSYSSPVKVVLEATSEGLVDEQQTAKVVNYFTANLRFIGSHRKAPKNSVDVPVLESYRELTTALDRNITEITIRTGKHSVLLNRNFKQILEEVIGPDEATRGSVSGRLEAINIHNKNKFLLYPIIGPSRVSGKFDSKLRKKFTAAVGCYVTVYGKLRYKTWDKFPYAIFATDIEIHPEGDSTLKDIKGIVPGATLHHPTILRGAA